MDNVSERGNGRLVVSYDASQTTIVWDLLTGDEVARFASYEEIRVAAWMRNGNIAFGKLGSSCDLRWLIPVEQEIRKGTSYFSNHGPSSISPRVPFSIPSPPWLLERIAERSRSGMQFQRDRADISPADRAFQVSKWLDSYRVAAAFIHDLAHPQHY